MVESSSEDEIYAKMIEAVNAGNLLKNAEDRAKFDVEYIKVSDLKQEKIFEVKFKNDIDYEKLLNLLTQITGENVENLFFNLGAERSRLIRKFILLVKDEKKIQERKQKALS